MPLIRLSDRTQRRLLFGWIVAFTGLTFFALNESRDVANEQRRQIAFNRTLAEEGLEAHDGLCALHADLERRAALSRQFLEDNPSGIPGITVATLRSSIANQEATLRALGRLDCTTSP